MIETKLKLDYIRSLNRIYKRVFTENVGVSYDEHCYLVSDIKLQHLTLN